MINVSILIPVYNVSNYIIRCLESVESQTYKGAIECIIVDDCSTDKSIELVKQFIKLHKGHINYRIIYHEHNRGLAAARNTGISNSISEFIFHLDSDDWIEPNAIELLVNKQKETNADIVSGNAIKHSINGNLIIEEPEYNNNMEMVMKTIEMSLDHVIWRRIIRKQLYTTNGIFTKEGIDVGEDHQILPRLAYYAKHIAKVDAVIYHYNCLNPNSYTSKTKKFNYKRYNNNLESINILHDFFINRNKQISNRLINIKKLFLLRMKFNAFVLNDNKASKLIQNEKDFNRFMYYMYFLKRVFTKILREVKIIK